MLQLAMLQSREFHLLVPFKSGVKSDVPSSAQGHPAQQTTKSFLNAESILKQLLLLRLMPLLQPSSRARAHSPSSIQHPPCRQTIRLAENSLQTIANMVPSSTVVMLFLCPDDVLCVGVLLQVGLDFTPGEGVQFLNTCDGCVAEAVGGSVLDQIGIDLA